MSATLLAAAGQAALTYAITAVKSLFQSQKADSLINITKVARVEPITMIDQRLLALPYLSDTLHSLVSLFSGYYLQALSLHMNVGSVNTLRLLDQLNPSRDQRSLLKLVGPAAGLESNMVDPNLYTFGLPRRGQSTGLEAYGLHPVEARQALESYRASLEAHPASTDKNKSDEEKSAGHGATFGKTAVQDISQSAPLSVGKMLEVTLTDGDKKLTLPITVRLLSTPVDSSVLTHILSDGGKNMTWKERWNAFRAGELEFWRDLVLATDLVDEHRKVLLKDKSGAYREILARRKGNAVAAATGGSPSLATASNLMVISTATAKEVERRLLGKMSDISTREKIFKMSYLMILAVIDPDNEMVTFYHRGIALPTTVSVRDLKVSNKSGGPDIGDVLQKLLAGKPASF